MNIAEKVLKNKKVKVVFCDLFDTLIHRTVHPNYVFKLWAKRMVVQLGLPLSSNQLFKIRQGSVAFLSNRQGKSLVEITYQQCIMEVYKRLLNTNGIVGVDYDTFKRIFEESDIFAERSVQFKNKALLLQLQKLKDLGYPICLVSDFHLPLKLVQKLLRYHDILQLFDNIYISSDVGLSKEQGHIYRFILNDLNLQAEETIMIGDNRISDSIHAQRNGIQSVQLKRVKPKRANRWEILGNDTKELKTILREIEKTCAKSKYPYSEYIIHFYCFIERLYLEAKKNQIKDIFFLAREGLYLKTLFDRYQDKIIGKGTDLIRTHYLKASRHSAMQIAFKSLESETFKHLKKEYSSMSLNQFLDSLNFPEEIIRQISRELNVDLHKIEKDFQSSSTMELLRSHRTFKEFYDKNRNTQKTAFAAYMDSFGASIRKDGIVLVDVGWGGTMQECIFNFFEKDIKVTGYYLGLKQIYDITENTPRFGLNFSIYPSSGFSDDILMANGQLYEQLLAAPHGSTLGYRLDEDEPTLEFHEENERRVFFEHIEPIQKFMLQQFELLTDKLLILDYDQSMIQDYITDMALRIGLFPNRLKLKFVEQASKGFYQNIGNNKVGLKYDPKEIGLSKKEILKQFLWSPEKLFRFLVKVKPLFFQKKRLFLAFPIGLAYYYIKLNRWVKKKYLSRELI